MTISCIKITINNTLKILTETTAQSNWKTRSYNIKIKKRKDSKTYQASKLKNINSTNKIKERNY